MAPTSRKAANSHKAPTSCKVSRSSSSRKAANSHKAATSHKAPRPRKTAGPQSSPLNAEQKALLKKLGLPTNFKSLSTDDRLEIDDVIGEELYENGIDETTDAPNAYGRLCESILEALEN